MNTKKQNFYKTFNMTIELRNFMDGLLLGDGHYADRKTSVRYTLSQICEHEDWVKMQTDFFNQNNIEWNLNIKKGGRQLTMDRICNKKDQFLLSTYSYATFIEERKRWYPDNIKIIPKDIDVTSPILLANWYMGDGSAYPKHNKPQSRLESKIATNGFSKGDVDWLITELKEKLNISSYINYSANKQPVLSLNHNNCLKLFDIIKPYITKSFLYKVPEFIVITKKCINCNDLTISNKNNAKYCKNCRQIVKLRKERERYNKNKIILI